MSAVKKRSFFNRNLVAIVIVPIVVGIHWFCDDLQKNEKFVKPSERKDLPIIAVS